MPNQTVKVGDLVGFVLAVMFLCILRTQVPPQPFPPTTYLPPLPWQEIGRIGEALNPGLSFAVGKYNEVIALTCDIPLSLVLTETRHTRESFAMVCAKATSACRHLISSDFCSPRRWVGRKDSHFRGKSGGVVLVSDSPTPTSSIQMVWEAWTSTRLVEAWVSLSFPLG